MHKMKKQLTEIKLIGLTARTNNKNEMDPSNNYENAKIGALIAKYWGNQLAEQIKHRVNPGISYSVYTDYESDEKGDYTYFVGEAVESFDDQDLSEFKSLVIPESQYQILTTEPGKMPDVVIDAWKKIWLMKENDFGSKRKYIADFEIYDKRAADPNNAVVDIYIGIE